MRASFSLLVLLAGLAGCDQLGIESTAATAARREAEGKAVGGGCRHAARSVEQCYEQNKRADKAAVFAGWREMNDYMRENKIEPVAPQVVATRPEPKSAEAKAELRPLTEAGVEATADKRPAKSGASKAREAKGSDS